MSQKSGPAKLSSERIVKDIAERPARNIRPRRKSASFWMAFAASAVLRSCADAKGIAESLYYTWSKKFLEAGPSESEGVRRGGTLVSALVPDGDRAKYEALLNRSTVNIQAREEAFRSSGWTGYDPKAPEFTADQVRAERNRYLVG